MWEIFKAELIRFRHWAIAYAFLHLLILGFLTRVVDLAQQPRMVYWIFGSVYALTGLLLGLYQMGAYRRPSTWLNLLHRPLPHWQVAAALFGAGAVLLLIAIALPALAIAGWQEIMTARVVDTRHCLLALAALLIALCSYLAGGYCMLGGRRYAVCVLVFLALLFASQASGFKALAVQGLLLLWLLGLVLMAFKPDLSAAPQRAIDVIATALPLQMASSLLILLLGFGSEMLWIMQGSHPLNTSTPPQGGHSEINRMTDKDRLLAGLVGSSIADAPLLREQVALSEVFGVGQQILETPVRFELTNIMPMEFDDDQRRVRWVFSHDSMQLQGYSLVDGRSAGSLGIGSNSSTFPDVVLAVGGAPLLREGDSILIGGGVLYHYDSETKQILPRIRLPAGELLSGVSQIGDNFSILSNRALYFFDGRAVIENDAMLVPRQRVPLPGKIGDLGRLELIELLEGYLISFSFTNSAHNLHGTIPYQQILRVADKGQIETVARHAISNDYPALYRYQAWWPSPAMHSLRARAQALFADPAPLQETAAPPVPNSIKILAGVLLLLSLLGAIWRTRQLALSAPARWAWLASCGLVGLPALVSLWLLYPVREQLDELPFAQAAAA